MSLEATTLLTCEQQFSTRARVFDSQPVFSSPFDFSDVSAGYNAFLRNLSRNHRIKQTICLVSRTWHTIAQELIFEYLFLQDGFDWTTLADGLEMSRKTDELYMGRGAGWYVRRLEICTYAWTETLAAAAARVIRCCPNLRVITVGATEGYGTTDDLAETPIEIVRAVFDTCPRALRALDWTCDLGPAVTHAMFALLPRIRELRSFFMCVQANALEDQWTSLDRPSECLLNAVLRSKRNVHTVQKRSTLAQL
jgi:hypothetical protein